MRLIKRYSNRKLYDTVSRSYVTLDVIYNMIKSEEQVQIIDNDTGEDMTAAMLSQIISDKARQSNSYSPSLFVQMIRKGGNTMYGYTKRFIQVIGEAAYLVEGEVEKKVKTLVTSGEITEEEGKEFAKDLKKHQKVQKVKIEKQIEDFLNNILSSLKFPTQKEVNSLNNKINLLEEKLKELENLLDIKKNKEEKDN